MSGTSSTDQTGTSGAAPGGGGSGSTSVGGSTSGVTGATTLPPQYSTGNLGFFTRQMEAVPTAITTGPDGALYVSELNGIPYPAGYSSIYRISDPTATTGFDGTTPSGVPQAYASGFSEVNGLAFNNSTGDMFVLEYTNANAVYDPTIAPADLPPSTLIQVKPDGTRATISGPELHLGQYVTVNQQTGDVYVAIDNQGPATATSPGTGEILDYKQDPTTGAWSNSVIASGLNGPRGMAFGPDGNLYVLEQGSGTPSGAPGADTAPVIPFIPGLVSERGGNTGSITKVDITSPAGGQQTVLTGLASFREFDPTTNTDRVISIGMNGLTISPDGTVYIAAGGGLAPETAAAVGPLADQLQGVLKVDGLFGSDPSQATVTPQFNSLNYAQTNGPDGATTLFNTESNLNDITTGSDGKLYAVDAARNDVYGLTNGGSTVDSVTVLQKQPPVLTPPQYSAVVTAGGNPTEQYAAEIASTTFKASNSVPDVPGNVPVASLAAAAAAAGLTGTGMTTTDATTTDATGASTTAAAGSSTTDTSATASGSSTTPAPRGEDGTGTGVTSTSGVNLSTDLPTLPIGASFAPALPGATDPVSPPVLANNAYANYYDPYFGNYAPAPSDPLVLPAGDNGSYTVSKLVVFGDRLADNGNTAALQKSLGQAPGTAAPPYSTTGNFSDGPQWTTNLAQILGATAPSQQQNFAYESATARDLGVPNAFDPDASKTPLDTFAGQIQQFETQDGSFNSNDLVSVTFGGNDISLPSTEAPEQGVTDSVNAIISGLGQLADMGAKHFLVSNLADVTLAPLFSNPDFLAATGATQAGFQGLVSDFNTQLAAGISTFQSQTGLDVKTLDLNTLFNGISANPSNFGFSNTTQPVLVSTPGIGTTPTYNPAIVGQDPQVQHGSLFLDPYFDPTALGQAIIAQTARSTLTTTPTITA
jgi:phospholipase/lecithinase/hemolysin